MDTHRTAKKMQWNFKLQMQQQQQQQQSLNHSELILKDYHLS